MATQTTRRRIIWTLVLAVLASVIQYFVREVLTVWGILAPLAGQIGKWLDTHVTAAQIGWTIATLLAIGAYIFALSLVWGWGPRNPSKRQGPLSGQRISARQAINYLASEARWGWRTWLRLRGDPISVTRLTAIGRFRDAARQAVIGVRGRRWDNQDHEDIDADLWNRIKIREASVLDPTNNPGDTEQVGAQYPNPPHFKELSIDAKEVYETWPPAGLMFRCRMRVALRFIKIWWGFLSPFEYIIRRWKIWRAENA